MDSDADVSAFKMAGHGFDKGCYTIKDKSLD